MHLPGQKNAFLLWCGSKQHKCANVTYCVFYVALSFKVIPWICVSAYTSIVKKRLRILLNLTAKRTANTHIPSPLVPLKQHYDRVKLGIEVAVTSFQGWWKREREFRWVRTIQGMLLIRGWCMSCPTLESAPSSTQRWHKESNTALSQFWSGNVQIFVCHQRVYCSLLPPEWGCAINVKRLLSAIRPPLHQPVATAGIRIAKE